MIVILALLFRCFLTTRLREAALREADQRIAGSMEGHAAMVRSVDVEQGHPGAVRVASRMARTAKVATWANYVATSGVHFGERRGGGSAK